MDQDETLKVAIDLLHLPSQVRRIRSAPLPGGISVLLRIVSGDETVTKLAAESIGCSPETAREAAMFFVEQILLFPGADSYRVLGATTEATNRELRRNMTLLLRWLHPDLDRHSERSAFTARVTRAWNDLKTRDRRADYDRLRRSSPADESVLPKKVRPQSKGQWPRQHAPKSAKQRRHVDSRRARHSYSARRAGLLHRILLLLFGRAENIDS
jgi:hypothetical protein